MHEPPSAPVVWRLGMTKGALVAVCLLTVAVGFGFWQVQDAADTAKDAAVRARAVARQTTLNVEKNTDAIQFICQTGMVLDRLVVQAAAQIDLNFRNGTYDRLLRNRILQPVNVQAARNTLSYYRKTHRALVGPQSKRCRGLPK